MLKDKHSGVVVSEMESKDKKALKNKVRQWVLAVLFIENKNRKVYSELVKTLEDDYLMGKEKYTRDMATPNNLLVILSRINNARLL